jgi:hypothetical protein
VSGAGEKQRRDILVVVRNVRLTAIMDNIAGITHHIGPSRVILIRGAPEDPACRSRCRRRKMGSILFDETYRVLLEIQGVTEEIASPSSKNQ